MEDAARERKRTRQIVDQKSIFLVDYLVGRKLQKNGVDASRLDSKGFGSANPIDSNDTRAGRANNRRVEIKVTNE